MRLIFPYFFYFSEILVSILLLFPFYLFQVVSTERRAVTGEADDDSDVPAEPYFEDEEDGDDEQCSLVPSAIEEMYRGGKENKSRNK